MTIVKITIVAWVLTFVLRIFIRASISKKDLVHAALNDGKLKMTFWRWMLVLLFVAFLPLLIQYKDIPGRQKCQFFEIFVQPF